MGDFINLFMWGHQENIQISFQISAESLFNAIDTRFDPKIFFLGILLKERKDRHSICLEPEKCGFFVENFSELKLFVSQLEKHDKEKNIFHTHPIAQENHDTAILIRSYKNAITQILDKNSYDDKQYFIGSPTEVDDYLVFTILSLNKEVVNSYYSLNKNKFNNRFIIYRSLIESTIDIFLNQCSDALKDPNNPSPNIKDYKEILREAGRVLMLTASAATKMFRGMHGLYNACNEIASMKYEGLIGIGNIILAPKDHKNIRIDIELKIPIEFHDYRKVRKFLEISNNDSSLIADSSYIYGLGDITGKYNPKEESIFTINFTSHYKWELTHDNNPLMIVEYGQPSIPKEKINRDKFYSDFGRIFKDITKQQIDNLWDIANEATKQKKGTMLVITDNAENESKRLGKQCFPLNPLKIYGKHIQQLTSIDGAVLLNKDSICYAIGVILDGIATEKGDSSRGSRYNSAIRYFENFNLKFSIAIVIISEDGMIDIIPDLMPKIEKKEIVSRIDKLIELDKEEKVDRQDYYPIINWFEENEFYLTEVECNTINNLRKNIEKKEKESASYWIMRDDLLPNNEMNDSYYK